MASVLGSGVFNWTLAFYARCLVIHGGLLYALRLQQTLSAAVKAGMRQSVCWAGWSRKRHSGGLSHVAVRDHYDAGDAAAS
jgi:hypothetical protein